MGIHRDSEVRGGMEHTDRNEINSSGAFWSGLFHDYHGWDGVCWYGRRSHHGLEISYYESNMEPVSILTGHERPVVSLSISAMRLYSGSLDKTIKVWDLMTLQCVQTLSEHKAPVTSVLCWDDKLLSCSLDKTVKLWTHSESGNLQVKYTHVEEHGLRTLFGMHRVGKTPVLFCSLHNSNCIRQLDLPSFEEVGTLFSKKEVRAIELADGGPLFTGDGSGELKVWRWAPQQDQDQEASSAAHS